MQKISRWPAWDYSLTETVLEPTQKLSGYPLYFQCQYNKIIQIIKVTDTGIMDSWTLTCSIYNVNNFPDSQMLPTKGETSNMFLICKSAKTISYRKIIYECILMSLIYAIKFLKIKVEMILKIWWCTQRVISEILANKINFLRINY